MRGKRAFLTASVLVIGLVGPTAGGLALAEDIWDLMNPAWWFGLDDDDRYHSRHRYGRYGWGDPWGGHGWGGGPWGPYGWGSYPGLIGPGLTVAQRAESTSPEPRLPE